MFRHAKWVTTSHSEVGSSTMNGSALLLCQLESRKRLNLALDDIVEPVFPRVGLGIVNEGVGEAGFAMLIGENETKLVLIRGGDSDGFRG